MHEPKLTKSVYVRDNIGREDERMTVRHLHRIPAPRSWYPSVSFLSELVSLDFGSLHSSVSVSRSPEKEVPLPEEETVQFNNDDVVLDFCK